ncbi:MAG TPA: hypothetical protein VLA52_01350, partial [Thermohalobaculum sp.]|nr:hypothetical protein [Thermohalobaculum sp.]
MTEARVNGVDPAGGCDTTTLVSFWPDGRLVALRPVEMPPGVKGAMFRGYHPRFGWRYLRLRARGREGVDQVWDITEEWARYHLRRIKGGQRDRALQAARARLRDERRARSRRLHVAEADGVIRPER